MPAVIRRPCFRISLRMDQGFKSHPVHSSQPCSSRNSVPRGLLLPVLLAASNVPPAGPPGMNGGTIKARRQFRLGGVS